MSRPTYRPPLARRLYAAASNLAFGLVVAGLALAGALWLIGCGGSQGPAQAPSNVTLAEDAYACSRLAKDLYQRYEAAKQAPADAGSE